MSSRTALAATAMLAVLAATCPAGGQDAALGERKTVYAAAPAPVPALASPGPAPSGVDPNAHERVGTAATGPAKQPPGDANTSPSGTLVSQMARENAALRDRVVVLEKQMAEVARRLQEQTQSLEEARQAQGALVSKTELTDVRKQMADDAQKRDPKRSGSGPNVDVQLYGKIKADAAFDTSRINTGDYARWVETEQRNRNDHELNMTANETRVGVKITGPDLGGAKTSGLIETDFFGGGAENKATPMMRHAYAKVDWTEPGVTLLAGQTWDVISPLNPSVLNYSVQWWAGNIGYRRPQIRLTKTQDLGGGTELKLKAALARTIGRTSGFDPGDSGEDSGLPSLQGRASLTFPFLAGRKATIGASGHYAREEYDTDAYGHNQDVDSWSANLDFDLPICSWMQIKGETFTGQDLDAYLGGIGQGTELHGTRVAALRSMGGWVAASLGPWDRWTFNVGYGGESIPRGDVSAATMRTCNSAIFGNAFFKINDCTSIGVEVSRWQTQYKGQDSGDSLRVQTSLIFSF